MISPNELDPMPYATWRYRDKEKLWTNIYECVQTLKVQPPIFPFSCQLLEGSHIKGIETIDVRIHKGTWGVQKLVTFNVRFLLIHGYKK